MGELKKGPRVAREVLLARRDTPLDPGEDSSWLAVVGCDRRTGQAVDLASVRTWCAPAIDPAIEVADG